MRTQLPDALAVIVLFCRRLPIGNVLLALGFPKGRVLFTVKFPIGIVLFIVTLATRSVVFPTESTGPPETPSPPKPVVGSKTGAADILDGGDG